MKLNKIIITICIIIYALINYIIPDSKVSIPDFKVPIAFYTLYIYMFFAGIEITEKEAIVHEKITNFTFLKIIIFLRKTSFLIFILSFVFLLLQKFEIILIIKNIISSIF